LLADTGRGLVDIVTRYAQTFLLLQRYDEGLLAAPPEQQGGVLPTLDEARAALAGLKADLIVRGEATDLFARERGDAFAALLGNLDQSVFGAPAYPSVEAKAAHLLYFVIKNHPFADGNKRSGAFLFVDFLNRNGRLLDSTGQPVINDIGLAALALLVVVGLLAAALVGTVAPAGLRGPADVAIALGALAVLLWKRVNLLWVVAAIVATTVAVQASAGSL